MLEASEDRYEHAVRQEHMTFFTLDNLLARFAIKVTSVNQWIARQTEVFNNGKHGNSRTEVETLLDAFSAYEEQVLWLFLCIAQLYHCTPLLSARVTFLL